MSLHKKYEAKHRAPRTTSAAPARALRAGVVASGIAAVGVTGVSVGSGVLAGGAPSTSQAATDLTAAAGTVRGSGVEITEVTRRPAVSRSETDRTVDTTKAADLSLAQGPATRREESLDDSDPRDIAKALLPEFGFSSDQFSCLDSLWTRESNWRVNADNPTSSAYGIPQALPGSKMSSAGADWATNPVTQITWGLGYIQGRYGSPCSAWGHSQSHGWY